MLGAGCRCWCWCCELAVHVVETGWRCWCWVPVAVLVLRCELAVHGAGAGCRVPVLVLVLSWLCTWWRQGGGCWVPGCELVGRVLAPLPVWSAGKAHWLVARAVEAP